MDAMRKQFVRLWEIMKELFHEYILAKAVIFLGIFCCFNKGLGWGDIQLLPVIVLIIGRVIQLLFWIGLFQLFYREFPVISVIFL